ncbi:MAG: hypothetical protein JXB00_04980 [Bacteroidales bacterium]|nr:hypothetical protein [Bacteroidales bacterium]
MKLEIYGSQNLNFVELNTTGSNDTYIRCDPESQFLDSIVFNIFVPCFENANKLFDFFGSTKYNSRKLIPLRNELISNLQMFENVKTIDDFEVTVSRKFLGKDFLEELAKEDKNWGNDWKGYLGKLIEINKTLIQLAEKCADEERILWVIGY